MARSVAVFIYLSLILGVVIGYFFNFGLLVLFLILSLFLAKFMADCALKRSINSINSIINIAKDRKDNFFIADMPDEFAELFLSVREIMNKRVGYINQTKNIQKDIEGIINSMEDGFLLLNNSYEIILNNKASLRPFRIGELKENRNLTHLYRRPELLYAISNAEKAGKTQTFDIRQKFKIYRISVSNVENGCIIFTKDVTKIVILETRQKEFITNTSHSLKTPLTSISGYAELISNNMVKEPEKIAEYAGKIHSQSKKLIELVNDILRLSEIEKSVASEIAEIDARQAIESVLSLFKIKLDEKGIKVSIKGDCIIEMNRSHFQEIMLNLIDNAIKYNEKGGEIFITLETYRISIRDTGLGIAEKDIEFIFNRFYRSPATSYIEGNGLGLAIAKNILKLYDAQIDCESNNNGTIFTINF